MEVDESGENEESGDNPFSFLKPIADLYQSKRMKLEGTSTPMVDLIDESERSHQKSVELTIVDLEMTDVISQLLQLHVRSVNDAFKLEINNALTSELIEKLLKIKAQFDNKEIDKIEIKEKILDCYKTNPYFSLHIRMIFEVTYFPLHTPGKGLCWIISEYQAYHRGLKEPNSEVNTWLKYCKHEDLEKVLNEAADLMKKQKEENYKEAVILDEKRSRIEDTHDHFLKAWNNPETKAKLIKDGKYSSKLPENEPHVGIGPKPLGRWGPQDIFGTLFFSGYGLNNCPTVNYFMDNKAIESNVREEGMARLSLVLPLSTEYQFKHHIFSFSLNDISNALLHNNNIVFSTGHYQPMDWPNELKTDELWLDAVKQITNETAIILCGEKIDSINSETIQKARRQAMSNIKHTKLNK
jgi:hypothetical protein